MQRRLGGAASDAAFRRSMETRSTTKAAIRATRGGRRVDPRAH